MSSKIPKPGTLKAKVVRILRETAPRVWTPKELAASLDANPSSIRKTLQRLTEESKTNPLIVRITRGAYRAFMDGEALKRGEVEKPKLHGILLTCKLSRNRGWCPSAALDRKMGSIRATGRWVEDETNGSYRATEEWRGRAFKAMVYPRTGTLQVALKASSKPLEPGDFGVWVDDVEKWLLRQGLDWDSEEAKVESLELNRDVRGLSLRGAEVLRIRQFENGWAQVYNKDRGGEKVLRAEVRVQDREVTLEEAVGLLTVWEMGVREYRELKENVDKVVESEERALEVVEREPWAGEVV